MRARRGVGILPFHKLERVNRLPPETEVQDSATLLASRQVESPSCQVVVDGLRCVRIVSPQIDIRTVRGLGRKRIENPRDNGPEGRVGGQRRALVRARDQDVAVNAAPVLLLPRFARKRGTARQWRLQAQAVVIRPGGLNGTDLEERSCGEQAVPVRLVELAVQKASRQGLQMNLALRRRAELAAEVASGDVKVPDDRRARAHADVDLLEDVVVDKSELDVLVAPALTRVRVDFAEQVQLGPLPVPGSVRGMGSLGLRSVAAIGLYVGLSFRLIDIGPSRDPQVRFRQGRPAGPRGPSAG